MKKLAFLLVAVSLFVTSPVMAENYKAYVTGRDLIERCGTENDPTKMATLPNCIGYIAAVIDLHESLRRADATKPIFCKPVRHDLIEMHKYVCKYLDENLDLLFNSASYLVVQALAELFPCTEP